ncbi:hypothetical protein [Gordonibacter massiliensis (ex Traore et al. 2017)]|uniref:hypothetical protein n=1 Tax=Gordonibacter massiliensis (ex Traore et al. 2017) TaxID=1841863 RepID=UPI001C8BA8A1|nr:hypothetical protein [Gordonibacter massiliensis (ex Traore et al. 2017)]MBX9035201.1 hypothetical protein [Gordonibacter massiliensis (ex Traore et al. 2017)]
MFVPVSDASPLADAELAPGDILRSEYGRTVRTVVSVEGDDVVVRTPKGSIEAIPLQSVRRFWRKIGAEA